MPKNILLQPVQANPSHSFQVKITNRQIFKICLPITASILVPQLNFIINNVFLGHLGKEWLGVAGITGVFYLLFAVIGNGLNGCLQMLISRKAGENKIGEISNIFWQGIRIAFVLAGVGILFTWFVMPFIFKQVLHNQQTAQHAIDFLKIRIFGLIFLYVYQLRNALLVGTNQTKWLVFGTASEAIANIILDYGFIFGNLGLPALGFNGAAIASIISEAIGLLVIAVIIQYKGIGKQLQLAKNRAFNKENITIILKKSIPLIGQFVISIASWEFFYLMIEHKGHTASAVSNVMRNVFGFFGCVTWAFAATTNTMVSNIIGQGLQHRVFELLRKILKLSVGFACLIFLVLNIFPTLFLGAFGQDNDFMQQAIPTLRVVSFAMILMSFAVVWLNAVTGTGNTKINFYIEVWAIVLYCTYVYVTLEKLNLSIVWGWGSEWLYWLSMFVPAYIYIKRGNWKLLPKSIN